MPWGMSRYSRNFDELVSKYFWRAPRVTETFWKSSWALAEAATVKAAKARKVLFMASSSSPEVGRGRRVAAVHVLVTVLAGVLDRAVGGGRGGAGRVDARVDRARVTGVQVASLAEPGLLRHQELVVVRAVRVVAQRAVLPHRRVLPEE